MIKIDGVKIPNPSTYQIGIMDLSKAERNARGDIIIERIATKRKIELFWRYLEKEKLSDLLTRVSPVFFEVKYINPQTDNIETGTFYCGDRVAQSIDYKNGVMRYKDIKFNLIER